MSIDIHQHLWPAPFLAALRARRTAPRLDGWILHLPGERPYAVDPARPRPRPARRPGAAATATSWCCRALGGASGSTACRRAEAALLADAWLEGALALPAPFRAWAMAPTVAAGPAGARRRAGPRRDRTRGRRRPARRPGRPRPPGAAARRARGAAPPAARPPRPRRRARTHPAGRSGGRPVVPYVAQLHAAWWAWAAGDASATRTCRSASSRWPASARSTASACAPAAAPAGRSTRSRSSRRPRTACRRSTPSSARSASTSSATARTARTPTPSHPALRRRRAARAPHRQPRATSRRYPPGGVRMTPDASDVLRALNLPSDRTLERHELQRLAGALAERPELWEPHIDPRANERTYACLHRDAHLDVWAIFWLPENDTGWHDHDTSSGAVQVVARRAGGARAARRRARAPDPLRRGRSVHVRTVAHPPADLRRAARGLDPHVLAPALAARSVHGRSRGRAAPHLGVLRRRAAPDRPQRAPRRRVN